MSDKKVKKTVVIIELEGEHEGFKLVIPIGMPHDRIREGLEVLAQVVEQDINTPRSLLDWGQTN